MPTLEQHSLYRRQSKEEYMHDEAVCRSSPILNCRLG